MAVASAIPAAAPVHYVAASAVAPPRPVRALSVFVFMHCTNGVLINLYRWYREVIRVKKSCEFMRFLL